MSQTTGRKLTTVVASVDGLGTGSESVWTSTGNATADDGVNASVSVGATSNFDSNRLAGSTFVLRLVDGGPIPTGAVIIKVDGEVEAAVTVTDSLVANVATCTVELRDGTVVKRTTVFTVNDNTTSAMAVRTVTTGGTEAVPQTDFAEADLAGTIAQLNVTFQIQLPLAALNNATATVDFIAVRVEWIKYETEGGAPEVGESTFSARLADALIRGPVVEGDGGAGGFVEIVSVFSAPFSERENILSSRALVDALELGQLVNDEGLPIGGRLTDFMGRSEIINGEVTFGDRTVQAQIAATVVKGEGGSGGFTELIFLTGGPTVDGNDARGRALIEALELGTTINGEAVSGAPFIDVPRAGQVINGEDARGDAAAFIFSFAGVTRDASGNPLGLCDVWLFRTSDRTPIAVTTSDASGNYSFALTSDPIEYFARAHLDSATRVFGTSDRNLTVDSIQFYP